MYYFIEDKKKATVKVIYSFYEYESWILKMKWKKSANKKIFSLCSFAKIYIQYIQQVGKGCPVWRTIHFRNFSLWKHFTLRTFHLQEHFTLRTFHFFNISVNNLCVENIVFAAGIDVLYDYLLIKFNNEIAKLHSL